MDISIFYTKFSPLILVLGIIILVILISFMLKKNTRNSKNSLPKSSYGTSPQITKSQLMSDNQSIHVTPEATNNEVQRKKKLANEYCDILQDIENNRASKIYMKTFQHFVLVYQTILGLYRRVIIKKEQMPDDLILLELKVALNNALQFAELTAKGFIIEFKPKIINKEDYLSKCMELDYEDLKSRLDDQQEILNREKSPFNFEGCLSATGSNLYELNKSFERQDIKACLNLGEIIKRNLQNQGCYSFFADDPEVCSDPLLSRQYYEKERSDITELPGLFARQNDEYFLIDQYQCAGTRRKK